MERITSRVDIPNLIIAVATVMSVLVLYQQTQIIAAQQEHLSRQTELMDQQTKYFTRDAQLDITFDWPRPEGYRREGFKTNLTLTNRGGQVATIKEVGIWTRYRGDLSVKGGNFIDFPSKIIGANDGREHLVKISLPGTPPESGRVSYEFQVRYNDKQIATKEFEVEWTAGDPTAGCVRGCP